MAMWGFGCPFLFCSADEAHRSVARQHADNTQTALRCCLSNQRGRNPAGWFARLGLLATSVTVPTTSFVCQVKAAYVAFPSMPPSSFDQ